MYRFSHIWNLVLITMFALLLVSCTRFDNPVELEPEGEGVTSGTVTVSVSGIARRATILVVDLYWTEQGASGENRWRKTLALDGKFAELFPDFHGLGPGIGYAVASTYVGTILYQQEITSNNIELEEGKSTTVYLTLPEEDGDIDLDFDFSQQDGDIDDIVSDGDKDDDKTDTEQQEYDEETSTKPSMNVNYSPVETDMNGKLNVKDNSDTWDEWTLSSEKKIIAVDAQGTTIHLMQNASLLQIGVRWYGYNSPLQGVDRFGLCFDPDLDKTGDEFVLYVKRDELQTINCKPLDDLNTCSEISGMPEGQPDWDAVQTEFAEGWEIEIRIDFEGLFINSGTAKKLGFAIIVEDTNVPYTWPDKINEDEPEGWGELVSYDNWDVVAIDGDEESDGDIDDIIDGDTTESDGDDDPDQTDSDLTDTEQDTDPDTEETDVEEDIEQTCTPNEIYCEKQGTVWHAILCGSDGQPSNDEACNQSTQCADHLCLDGQGCYFDFKTGDSCDDGLVCTENDRCSGGNCAGDAITCPTYDCKTKIAPTADECCVYENVTNGQLCGTASDCNVPKCQDGVCSPDFIEGCCPGHPDMIRIQEYYNENYLDFCIDKYEAVVADTDFFDNGCLTTSNGNRYGENSDDYPVDWPDDVDDMTPRTLKACNNPGHIPSRFLTYRQAEKACIESGKRLCKGEEFLLACAGIDLDSYPYANVYDSSKCNGSGGPVSGSGDYTDCKRDGVYDLSGNLSEWTKSDGIDPQSCGGNISSDEAGLSCLSSCSTIAEASFDQLLGFRCCIITPQE